MVLFNIFSVKVQLLVIATIIIQSDSKSAEITGTLPNFNTIIDFLRAVVQPYVQTLARKEGDNKPATVDNAPIFRTKPKESDVELIIKKKVEELRPLLEDGAEDEDVADVKDTDDKLTLDTNDDTTIIEFIDERSKNKIQNDIKPNENVLKQDVAKYKELRDQIKTALIEEAVSDKTKSLVTKTLDKMLARMISNQCSWNNGPASEGHKVFRSAAVATQWNEEWKALREKYTNYMHNDNNDGKFPGAKLFEFFEQFHDFLAHIEKDTQSLTNRYKIVCQVMDRNALPKSPIIGLRQGTNDKKKPKCEKFKLCSEELKKFLLDFYNHLNDTAVSTLRNYASMYVRDVNTDDTQEKDTVVMLLNKIGDIVEYKIRKLFKKETINLKLNENKNKDANVKAIKNYIKRSIESAKIRVKGVVEIGLQSLRNNLMQSIKKDLYVNLDVDLGNLREDFKGRICSSFSVCNGKYHDRRFAPSGSKSMDSNGIYVKIQLSMDDALKNKIARTKIDGAGWETEHEILKNEVVISPRKKNINNLDKVTGKTTIKIALRNVTRTTVKTLKTTVKKLTTKTKKTQVTKTETKKTIKTLKPASKTQTVTKTTIGHGHSGNKTKI